MANIVMDWVNKGIDYVGSRLFGQTDDLGKTQTIEANYYKGDHRPQLKSKIGATDDNVIQNFVGLAVDRSVSRLWKGGLIFNLPDGYQVGLHGSVYGTGYFKICPDELVDPYTGELFPRLIPIDPEIIRVHVKKHDMNDVEKYVISYNVHRTDANGEVSEVGFREITHRADDTKDDEGNAVKNDFWVAEEWYEKAGGQWEMGNFTPWEYDFPPIIHWKNLPSLKSCYGDSDIDDVIGIQDKSNFVTSNTGKIIKFFAHPETIGIGFDVKDITSMESAVGSFKSISNENAKVFNLEMQSDLASSVAFGQNLRQSIFDIAREVDISSMADKLGQLTNFGLQVLWSDAMDKNDTKRQLYGDAILELNRRLLVLKGFEGSSSNPGALAWGNPLPVNIKEELEADKIALEMKIIDLETLTKKYKHRYGQDYETIQANIARQGISDNQNNSDIGATILKNFNQGKG